jgi:hypothetical protein
MQADVNEFALLRDTVVYMKPNQPATSSRELIGFSYNAKEADQMH